MRQLHFVAMCAIMIPMSMAGCDPAPCMELYNDIGKPMKLSLGTNSGFSVPKDSHVDGVYVLDGDKMKIATQDNTWLYEKSIPPKLYWKPSMMTRIYLFQVEPDGRIVVVRYQDLTGNHDHPATQIPTQPPGFPLQPLEKGK